MQRYPALLAALLTLVDTVAIGSGKPQEGVESVDHVRVTGRLVDAAGLPLALVKLDVWNARGQAAYSAATQPDGSFTVRVLPRSSFTLVWQSKKDKYAELTMYIGEPALVALGDVAIGESASEQPSLSIKGTMGLKQHSAGHAEPPVIAAVLCTRGHGIHVLHGDGSTAKVDLPKSQTPFAGCRGIQISGDNRAAGLLALSDFCCTSYPIAQQVVVYRRNKPARIFEGDKRAIFRWAFRDSGRQVAFYQDFLHGTQAQHYELRDVETGRLVGTWNGEISDKAPRWTADVQE